MIFPDISKSCEVVMQTTKNGLIASFNDEELYELIKTGKIRTMLSPYIPAPEYPNTISLPNVLMNISCTIWVKINMICVSKSY